jgi:uncharacterized BrkB/YihY/UPF0761 family membrane protein
MLSQLLGAVRSDVNRQIVCTRTEFKRQARHTVLIGVLASAAALASLGAVVVGPIALHHWLGMQYDPFAAYGAVRGSLLPLTLILLTFAFSSAVRRSPPRKSAVNGPKLGTPA